jgi:hypothetical protein
MSTVTVTVKVLCEPHRGIPGSYRVTVSTWSFPVSTWSTVYTGSRASLDEFISNVRYQAEEMAAENNLGEASL